MTNPRTIKELLESPKKALELLRVSAARAEGVLEEVRGTLPGPLAEHLLAASFEEGVLVLVADSGAFATRLRYAAAQSREALEARLGVSLARIRLKVRGRPDPAGTSRKRRT